MKFCVVICALLFSGQVALGAAEKTPHRVLKSKISERSNKTFVDGVVQSRAVTDCIASLGGTIAEGMLVRGIFSAVKPTCIYGNYCGLGCYGADFTKPVVDSVDECCRTHDYDVGPNNEYLLSCKPNQILSECLRDRIAYRVQEKLSSTAINQAVAIKTVIDLYLKCVDTFSSCPVPSPIFVPNPAPSPSPKPTAGFPSGTYRITSGSIALSYYRNVYSVKSQPPGKGLKFFKFMRAPTWQGLTNVYYISAVSRAGFFLANDDCSDIDEDGDYEPDGIVCGPLSIQKAVSGGLTQVWIVEGSYPNFRLKHPNQMLRLSPPYLIAGPAGTKPRFSASGTTFTLQKVG